VIVAVRADAMDKAAVPAQDHAAHAPAPAGDCRGRDCCGPGHEHTGSEHGHASTLSPRAAASEACGCHGTPVFDGMDTRYKRVLWLVIGINAAMFLIEVFAGYLARSQALQADALDFLGDTLTYGLSLAVIGASLRVRAMAALFKGVSLSLMGLWVLGSTLWAVLVLGTPRAEIMGGVGLLALAANLASVLLLMRYKDGDANVRSVWLCSRNDAIGNVIVMVAAVAVWGTASAWPDLVVAAIMAGLFLNSSFLILRQAYGEYRLQGGASQTRT
jgi:Co/Zn/Cd efflux system component